MMKQNVVKTSAIVTIILFLGYVIAFFRESVIAYFFGVSADVDAYTVAISIPINLFTIITISVHSIIIPIYSKLLYQSQNKEDVNRYVNTLLTIMFLGALVLVALFEITASPITYLFAPGLDSDTHNFVVFQFRLVLPTIIFSLLCHAYKGILNVHKSFILPSLSVWLLNIGIIIAIIVLNSRLGILSACIGQIIGALLQFVLLYYPARKHIQYKVEFDIKNPNIIDTGKQIIPIFWSSGLAELNDLIGRAVASMLFVGAISTLNYSTKVNNVLISFFTTAIATIVYPLYAESSAKGNITQLNNRLNLTLSAYTYFLLPIMLGVLCLKKELITVAFGRGAFSAEAIDMTQELLGYQALGILFIAFRETVTKVYYSIGDTKTPARNASYGIFLNIILSILLPLAFGVIGLPIAYSISVIFIALLLIRNLLVKNTEIQLTVFFENLKKILFPSIVMTVSIILVRIFLEGSELFILLISSVVGTIVYLYVSFFAKVPVLYMLISQIAPWQRKKRK